MPSSPKRYARYGTHGFYGSSYYVTIYQCYGNAIRNDWQEIGAPNWDSGNRHFYPGRIKEPSNLFLWCDALRYNPAGYYPERWVQWMHINPYGFIWLTHNGKANVVLLDGHVETCDPKRIAGLSKRDVTRNWTVFPSGLISEDGGVTWSISMFK